MKIPLALATAALLASTLAACGGGDGGGQDSEYCKDVKKASKTFKNFSDGDVDKVDSAFATFHNLAAEAPSDIKKDWKKLDDVIVTIEDAFKEAGLKMSDLADVQKGKLPEGVDVSKLQSLATDFQKLNDAEFTAAAKRIDEHAKKDCKVTLHVSS
jgi:cytochrome c556